MASDNLDNLSDDELNALVIAKAKNPGPPDKETLARLHALDQPTAPADNLDQLSDDEIDKLVTAKQQNAATPKNLFPEDMARVVSSFGNDTGIAKKLAQSGFTDAKRNSKGDLVVKGPDGKWYKDANNFFTDEAGLAGWFPEHPLNWVESHLGGALPGIGMLLGGKSAGIPGAGGGAAIGEGLRQSAGRSMGVYDAGPVESSVDMAKEGALGAGGEIAGPYISKAVKAVAKPVAGLAKKGIAKTSELLTGIPSEAIERLMARPTEVLGAEKPGNALRVATGARDELLAKNAEEKGAISQARKEAVKNYGAKEVPTAGLESSVSDFLEKNAPEPGIEGALSPQQYDALLQTMHKTLSDQKGDPKRTFAQLQKIADELSRKIDTFEGGQLPGSTSPYQAQLKSLRSDIKGLMHDISPELKSADARYSQYAKSSKMLKGLEKPETMEGFINNYFGKNKSIMREASEKVIPKSLEELKDMGASRAFTKQGPAGSEMGKRSIFSGGLGAGLALKGNPYLGALAAASTSPTLHKQVIGRGSQLLNVLPTNAATDVLSKYGAFNLPEPILRRLKALEGKK